MAGVGMILMISFALSGLGLILFLTFSRRQHLGIQGKETPLNGSPQSIVMAGAGLALLLFQWDSPISALQWLMVAAAAAGLILLAHSLRQGLFASSALLLFAGMLMKLIWDDEGLRQLGPLVFLISYECAAAGLMIHSAEPAVRQRLKNLMLWLALLFGIALAGRNNAQWLPLQSFLQLICAYKIYSRALDFREQFYFVQKQRLKLRLNSVQAGILVMISALLLAGVQAGLVRSESKNARPQVWVYRTEDEHLSNLIVIEGEKLNLNLAYPVSDAYADTRVKLRITETESGEIVYESEEALDDQRTAPDSYWIISERPGINLSSRRPVPWTITWSVLKEETVLETRTLNCDPLALPAFAGEGQYFIIRNLTAGYGYFSSPDVQARNTLQINPLRFRNLGYQMTMFDAQDQPVIESSSNGTIRAGLTLSHSASGWGINFEDDEVVRGEITICVSDAKGKKFYEETIELVKQP